MKHFLLIFILFISLILTPLTGKTQNSSGLHAYLQNTVDAASVPASPWQETEFGKARVVADKIGLKGAKNLILGLEIQLKKDWTLKQPDFEVVDPDLNLLVYPNLHTEKEVQENWDTDFQGNLLFPFFLKGPFTKDINLQLQSRLEACHPDLGCRTQILFHAFPIPFNQAGASLWQGSLYLNLRQVAFPAEDVGIDFQTELERENSIRLRLTFPEDISALEIQGSEILGLAQSATRGNVFEGILETARPVQEGDILPVFIRSSVGCFTLDLIIQNTPILPLPDKLPFGLAFWSGLLFFLLSPAWCYWMNPLQLAQKPQLFKEKTRYFQALCLIGIIFLGCAWGMDILTEWYQCPVIKILTIGILALLFIFPYPKWYFLPLLFVILPKPFWGRIGDITAMAKIGLLIWWAICICFPFNIWILAKKYVLKFFQAVQADLSYQLCVRLPYMLLMGWVILSLCGILK